MALPDVLTNLATAQAADEERRRREARVAREQEAADLKRAREDRLAEDATGPAALLKELTRGGRAAVPGDVRRDAEQDQFLNAQAQRRFDRRGADLERKAAPLSVPGPSVAERTMQLAAPLGPFADEDPNQRASELKYDPRGRGQRIASHIAGLERPTVSRETPIYTDAPDARGSRKLAPGITVGGEGVETMPYTGALDDLLGMEVPRSAIRKEFGGTADDRVLSFSDRREPGMRRYNNPRTGETRDVGARGGGLIQGKGEPDTTAQDAALAFLRGEADVAKRMPFTPQERAADLSVQEPGWDTIAAEQGPLAIGGAINEAVGQGRLNPATGQYLLRKYAALADDTDEGDGPDPALFAERLRQGRPPAPGEAEARAVNGGQALPAAQAAEQQATAEALQPAPAAPGSTPSPALAGRPPDARDALLAEIRQPGPPQWVPYGGSGGRINANQPAIDFDAPFIPPGMREGEAVPPWLADLPEDIRLVLEGMTQATGGREAKAERQRRLAREASRRGR